jgi:hypothetical protein
MKQNNETSHTKSLSPQQKLDEALKLYYTARELKRAGLKLLYPDLDNEKIEKKITEIFLSAKS